ncbi:unnamed protein product, partial [Brassica oleracea]
LVGCRELPREWRPQNLNATAPTASDWYPRANQSIESKLKLQSLTRMKKPPAIRGEPETRRYRRSVVYAGDYRLHCIPPGPCTPI